LTNFINKRVESFSDIEALEGRSVVVDCSALYFHILSLNVKDQPCMCINLGGDCKSFRDHGKKFLESFIRRGVKLIIVCGGLYPPEKKDDIIERRIKDLERSNVILESVRENGVRGSSHCEPRFFQFISDVVKDLIKELNIKLVIAEKEADPYIARIARDEGCCAVMSHDSDFMIYNTEGFISLKQFSHGYTGSVRIFKPKKLAKNLNLSILYLPLLASLVGNDCVPAEEYCHDKLNALDKRFHRKGYRGIVSVVARYICRKEKELKASPMNHIENICAELCSETTYRRGKSLREEEFCKLVMGSISQYESIYHVDGVEDWYKIWDDLNKISLLFESTKNSVFSANIGLGDGVWIENSDIRASIYAGLMPLGSHAEIEEYISKSMKLYMQVQKISGDGYLLSNYSKLLSTQELLGHSINALHLKSHVTKNLMGQVSDSLNDLPDNFSIILAALVLDKSVKNIPFQIFVAILACAIFPGSIDVGLACSCSCPCTCRCENRYLTNSQELELLDHWESFKVVVWHVNNVLNAHLLYDLVIKPTIMRPSLAYAFYCQVLAFESMNKIMLSNKHSISNETDKHLVDKTLERMENFLSIVPYTESEWKREVVNLFKSVYPLLSSSIVATEVESHSTSA